MSPYLQTTQRFWSITSSGSVGVTVLLLRNTEQWYLFMCDKQVFTLLTTVPYGTEVLSRCLALTGSIPARPPPALRLLPATPVAT